MLNLTLIKSEADSWLPLPFNFASITPTVGAYIIWHGGQTPRIVRVGQGDIANRLLAHSRTPEIRNYSLFGQLMTTWAAVPGPYLDGVERFLADRLLPLTGDRRPDAAPIPVNLPWAA